MSTMQAPPPISPYPSVPPPAELPPEDRPRPLTVLTPEDWLSLGGSLLGSLALTWLLYTQILPFHGDIGFVLFWFVTYLGMFGAITAMVHPPTIVIDRLMGGFINAVALFVGAALVSTLVYVLVQGWPAIHHLNFFTQNESEGSLIGSYDHGGVLNALVGSLIELGIATAVTLPLGIGTAVYMVEVGGKYAKIIRTIVEAMTALPDILAGLFIYTTLIVRFGVDRSGFAAAMALSVMMLPIIARSADVALRVVPGGLREASLALGASQWQTVWRVVLPTCRSGLATAVILGMARAVGETAPVLITSGANTFLNTNPFKNPMNSLPLYIVNAARSGNPVEQHRGFAAGIVLMLLVLILFGTARYLARPRTVSR